MKPLELPAFDNKRLCIVTHFCEYLQRTKSLRAGDKLLVSFVNPYHHISRDALWRWLKTVLDLAGIHLKKFSGHSTRTASTSQHSAEMCHWTLSSQLKGWSRQKTFSNFWCKQSTGAMPKSRWPSWAPRPNESYGLCGRKATLSLAYALISLSLICQPTSEDVKLYIIII